MPDDIPVSLATLVEKPFSPDWLFEIKWDGERAIAWIRDGEVEFRSRSARNITHEYPELKELPKRLNARKAIVDGEIVVLDEAGRSDFMRIQPRFGVTNPSPALQQSNPVTYYMFDLLYCDGYDLRGAPLEQRKELLRNLLNPSDRIRFSDHQIGKGIELYELAKQERLEGIIAKRRDSPYPGKRSSLWLKLKVLQDMDVVIGGWTAPRKSRDHFGALLMGLYDGENLEYIGSVGTGFTQGVLSQTYAMLQKLYTSECPFVTRPKVKEAMQWVKPELVARVKYGHWTQDRKLRQPVFLGFQEDRSARECQFEDEVKGAKKNVASVSAAGQKKKKSAAAPTASIAKEGALAEKQKPRSIAAAKSGESPAWLEKELAEGAGESLAIELGGKKLNLTHLNKRFFPKPVLRKRDLLCYYLRVAEHILPFLKDRPLVLKRYPNGIDGKFFFQKEAPSSRPDWIKTVEIDSEERGGKMPYFVAEDTADLLYLTTLGCIDHNPWSSRFDDEDHPDYFFFDLDPTDGTSFDTVLAVARAIQKTLSSLGLRAWLKTSGASGFHMYVPIEREFTYEQVRLFAGAIGQRVQAELPDMVTFERTVSKRRKGTVLFDSLQNARGKPLASVYSLRPFSGAPVSTPVTEKELAKGFRPADFNIETIFKRLKHGDLWADFWSNPQRLRDAVKRAG